MEQKDSMKINKLVSQLLGIRLARLGFTGIIALLSWSLIISKAEAGVKAGKQGTQPPTAKNKRGSGQGIEGSNVFGDGAEIFFSNFSIEDNSNLPGNVISNGDGSLLDLVNTAADVWTQALPEFEDIQINIAWADFGLVPLAESETLGSTEEVRKERADLVENFQFNSFDNRLLLTSTINQSIEDALTHDDSETDEFILTAGSGLLGEFTTNSEEEIDEFEETFISIRPDNTEPDNIEPGSTEIDSLAAIFIPTIFEADKTTDHGDQFPSAGTIIFNSQDLVFDLNGDGIDETIKFFLDDNPLDSKVFGSATQFKERDGTDSLAGINIGRSSFAENNQFPLEAEDENVLVVDLFSVVLHELQHALGTTRVNSEATDNDSFKEGENRRKWRNSNKRWQPNSYEF